jgi:FtsH-binding integral membrane protein
MEARVKKPFEYAVIALLIAGFCLWQLISSTQDGEPPAGKLAVLGLGLLIAGTMHCVFMMQIVQRTGRSFVPWFVAIVLLMPLGSAVLLALLLGDNDTTDS